MSNPAQPIISLKSPILWSAFLLYLIVAALALFNHEMWADELHSWNIAKGSSGFFDIFRNSRYEGHPPLWYIILWSVAQFTHNLVYVQAVHLLIAAVPVFLILFYSPFSVSTRLLIPFGYYFLFEYAIISRNYAIGVLLAFVICVIMRKNFRYKIPLYYVLVLLLSNTHLLAMLLAASLHVYFLFWQLEQKKKAGVIIAHVLAGIVVAMPALYFIFPPADSLLNLHFQSGRWGLHRVKAFLQAPMRAFLPVPGWWKHNWWNAQFLLEAKETSGLIRLFSLGIVAMIPVLVFLIFRKDRKSLGLFFANLLFSFIVAVPVITLGTARYSGFIFIGFIAALWLYCYERPLASWKSLLVNLMLFMHVIAGIFAVVKEIKYPFSNSYRVNELVRQIPENKKMVCDYWALNTFASFVDKPVYCIDLQKEAFFVLLDSHMQWVHSKKNRYVDGLIYLHEKTGIDEVYMISTHSPQTISKIDSLLNKQYQVNLVDKIEGAIEKAGNLYLYNIRISILTR